MTRYETFGEDLRPCSDARGLAQTACNNRVLHRLSCARPRARLLVKSSCGASQFCIMNHTVPVFAKNTSCIDSSVRFSPFLLLRFLRNKPSSNRKMASPAKRTAEEQEDTDYDPQEEESGAGIPEKGRRRRNNRILA